MNQELLNVNVDLYVLPTAQEVREFQSYRRKNIIRNIKINAEKGYYSVSIIKEDIYEALKEELIEKGYKLEFIDKYCKIKWGKN